MESKNNDIAQLLATVDEIRAKLGDGVAGIEQFTDNWEGGYHALSMDRYGNPFVPDLLDFHQREAIHSSVQNASYYLTGWDALRKIIGSILEGGNERQE